MKKLLNTLYVTTQGSYLAKEGETVLVRVEHENRLRVPLHTLSGIVCFGQVSCSPPLMGFCVEKDVALSFLTEHGKFLARVQGPVNGNVLLRREQYRRADDPASSVLIVRAVVQAKIANCRTVLLRGMREHGLNEEVENAIGRLARSLQLLEAAASVDSVRGVWRAQLLLRL
jgi:CRISP-associated protein Cas1